MTLAQLLLRWLGFAVLVIIASLIMGKKPSVNLFGTAILSAAVVAGLTAPALYPLTQSPGFFGLAIGWLQHFLVFSILFAAATPFSRKRILHTGLISATLLALMNARC